MLKYKVLWLDDECETLESIVELAAETDIELFGYIDAESGINELTKRNVNYDAVLLDGKFHKTGAERGARALGNTAFTKVALTLKELKAQGRIMPWFVLSGQPNFVLDKDDWIGEITDSDFAKGKIFDKSKDEDLDALWQAIKDACDKLPDTKIQHQHHKVFEACEKYVPDGTKHLMTILKAEYDPTISFDSELYYNQLRKLVEYVFRAANKRGLLHDKCVPGHVMVNESYLFLSGKPTQYLTTNVRCTKTHFPKVIDDIIIDLIKVCNLGSHSEQYNERPDVTLKNHLDSVGTPYLLFSLTYRLMDVLIWFKTYVEENPDVEANKRLWQDLDTKPAASTWLAGRVTQINDKGWGTFVPDGRAESLSILPEMVKDNSLLEGMEVKVLAEPQSNGKTFIKDVRL